MTVFCRLAILVSLLIPMRILAQDSVTIDLSKAEYILPLNYTSKTIGTIIRSYGYPNAVNLTQESKIADGLISMPGNGYPVAISVGITREAKFADAHFTMPVNFSNTFFDSASDFRGAHFSSTTDFSEATFYATSSFTGARFDSTSLFSSTFFQLASNFMGAHFKTKSYFSKADFRFPCFFSGAQFSSESDFTDAHFYSLSNFTSTHFDSTAVFSGSEFDSTIFSRAEFRTKCDFNNVVFNSFSDFSAAQFHAATNFSKAKFNATADFNEAHFDKDVSFAGAHFKHNASLLLSKIKVTNYTSFDFSHAVLPDSIDFSYNPNIYSGVSAIVDFTQADSLVVKRFGTDKNAWQKFRHLVKLYFYPSDTAGTFRKHNINLYNTDISKIKIDYDHFKFYASDIENHDSVKNGIAPGITRSIYEGLLKNFENRGQAESYEKLDIEYKRYKDGLKPGDFSLQDMWWGFGYERWRIFVHALLLIFFFSLISYFYLPRLNDKSNGVYHIAAVPEFSYKLWDRPFNRLWCSLIYTSAVFFSVTLKMDKLKFSKPAIGALWIIVIYATGLFCMAFMANWFLHN